MMQDLEILRFAPTSEDPKEPRFEVSAGAKQWSARAKIWQPPTDMYETEDSIVVLIEIAGMSSAEFLISLEKRTLAIGGVRPTIIPGGACHQLEIPSGEFVSIVELPAAIDYDKVEAEYTDGFLQVVLPKTLPTSVKINE
jgi:HSP20 family protein